MSKLKKMCKAVKNGHKYSDEDVMQQIKNARYICKDCLRTAEDKKLLCKPEKIK